MESLRIKNYEVEERGVSSGHSNRKYRFIKQEEALASPAASSPPVTKPRDIPILELNHLEGLEASAHLQMFIELVEQATPNDASRVQVVKTHLGSEIVMLVHNYQRK